MPACGTHVCTMIYISYMCETSRLHTLDDTPAWSAQASWPCKLWWQQIIRIEVIFPFIVVWDDVWMKYGLRSEEATWKLPNCLSTMQSLLGLPFSPQGAGVTPWWVSLTLCLGWWSCKPDQTNHSTDCVQCHAQGRVRWLLRGFVCLCNALRGEADR